VYLDKLPGLKKTLLDATELSDIFEYFFNELGSDHAFARSGEPTTDPRLLTTLAQVAARTAGEAGAFEGTACRIASHRFVHGTFTLAGKWTAIVIYFEDLEQGFMALGDEGGPSRFTRFSLVASPDGEGPAIH
jgi:hypothetical protein